MEYLPADDAGKIVLAGNACRSLELVCAGRGVAPGCEPVSILKYGKTVIWQKILQESGNGSLPNYRLHSASTNKKLYSCFSSTEILIS